jgi:hypothetical protein
MTLTSKIIMLVSLAVIIFTVWFKFSQYTVQENYILYALITCDPTTHNCFTTDCDPENEECDTSTYKKVEMTANAAPACVKENNCEEFACESDDPNCSETYCSEDTLEEGERCTENTETIEETNDTVPVVTEDI